MLYHSKLFGNSIGKPVTEMKQLNVQGFGWCSEWSPCKTKVIHHIDAKILLIQYCHEAV